MNLKMTELTAKKLNNFMRNGVINMKAINIEWDIDYSEDLDVLQILPDEMEIPNGMTDEEEISDYITNETGFCHKGFELKM